VEIKGLVIVGSGPAGVSAAEAFRHHNPDDPIRIITDDPALPYARPPLSKEFLRGDAEPADTELHPAAWFDERSIELIQAVGVDSIDVAGHYLTADGKRYPYRSLVLACGAKPALFPVPGGEAQRYAGSASVDSLADGAVRLDDGATIECDLVVDAQMRTSVDNVFAAGDVALAYNSLAGRPVAVEHWQDAVDQGEIAGAGAAGQTREWDAAPGFWTTIGEATLKYHAWGDGFDRARFVGHTDGFTVWYERDRAAVGVLTLNADEDYDHGEELISARAQFRSEHQ
jgi:NADPH-dependent 2,4-dienoyl-CoA reductase/sulfur reductase-like enzyme